jgi:hypothetical protein
MVCELHYKEIVSFSWVVLCTKYMKLGDTCFYEYVPEQ